MGLCGATCAPRCASMMKNEVRVRGHRRHRRACRRACGASSRRRSKPTATIARLTVGLCVSYGGREDIVGPRARWRARCAPGASTPDAIDATALRGALGTAGMPDPDLLIRTSGEMRISNFFLWQMRVHGDLRHRDAVAGLPRSGVHRGARAYQQRERRFGRVGEQSEGERAACCALGWRTAAVAIPLLAGADLLGAALGLALRRRGARGARRWSNTAAWRSRRTARERGWRVLLGLAGDRRRRLSRDPGRASRRRSCLVIAGGSATRAGPAAISSTGWPTSVARHRRPLHRLAAAALLLAAQLAGWARLGHLRHRHRHGGRHRRLFRRACLRAAQAHPARQPRQDGRRGGRASSPQPAGRRRRASWCCCLSLLARDAAAWPWPWRSSASSAT